jgi:hypothetical protein
MHRLSLTFHATLGKKIVQNFCMLLWKQFLILKFVPKATSEFRFWLPLAVIGRFSPFLYMLYSAFRTFFKITGGFWNILESQAATWNVFKLPERSNQILYFKFSPQKVNHTYIVNTIRAHTKSTDLIFRTTQKYFSCDTIPLNV